MGYFSEDKIRKWFYYKITNPNGSVYIGKTCDIKARIRHYRAANCKNQKKVLYSILKYGWDNHTFDVFDELVGNKTESSSKEMFWIRTYMSNYAKYREQNGLNLSDGGEGGKGRVWSDEDKRKMSEMKTGFRHTEDSKKRIGEAAKGNKYSANRKHTEEWKNEQRIRSTGNKYALGMKHTEEWKKRMSDMRKGVKHTEERRLNNIKNKTEIFGIPIWVLNKNNELISEHGSINEAARVYDIKDSESIRLRLTGKTKSNYKDLIFKYK